MNSKAKGSAYEREKCRQFSLWITSGKRDDCLWRSASSGAVFTVRSKKGDGFESQVGDIASIRKESKWFLDHFGLECKSYKDLQLANLLCNEPSAIQKFWKTHVELCCKVGKTPILIAKQNFKPDLLIGRGLVEIGAGPQLGVWIPQLGAMVYRLDSFLEGVKYKQFEKNVKSLMCAAPKGVVD